MAQAGIWQRIAFVIVTSVLYVESIRNAASPDNEKSSIKSTDAFPEAGTSTRRQSSSSFRPSQLLEFTAADVLDLSDTTAATSAKRQKASTHSALTLEHPYATETRYSPDATFSFPTKSHYHPHQQRQQYQSVPADKQSNQYNNNNNYHASHTTPNDISAQLQLHSAPIATSLDPYANGNNHYSPAPDASVLEYTVHSSMQVQNPHTPAHQRQPPPSLPSPPTHLPLPFGSHASTAHRPLQASEFSHKHDRLGPLYSQHPNVILGYTERELLRPGALAAPPPRLSYASKDYPPPSYLQPSSNQAPPQRQDYSPASTQTSSASSAAPNYANSYPDNYLPSGGQYEPQQQNPSDNYYRPLWSAPSRGGANRYPPSPQTSSGSGLQIRPGRPPTYHSYPSEYQQGEVPPSHVPSNSRPTLFPYGAIGSTSPPQQAAGLTSLASLFSSTQQHAPQFANLGSLLGAFTGAADSSANRPINTQLVRALENIARNDDLQCVPKVLCQLIAGQTQRGQLPTFVTSPAITNFLAAFPASSPALIFGRAVLLGISGGVPSCVQTYVKCPKREDEILYYLNNHRGGFFKFFSEPEPEPQKPNQSPSTSSSGSSSLFSILSFLAGNPSPTSTTPRPTKPRPTSASTDITSNIGTFFTNLLSTYMSGVEYQRRKRRAERSIDGAVGDENGIKKATEKQQTNVEWNYYDDEEDDEDENKTHYLGAQSRILHKDLNVLESRGPTFFPPAEHLPESLIRFDQEKESKKYKFPTVTNKPREERQESPGGEMPPPPNSQSFVFNSGTRTNYENANRVRFRDEDNSQGNDQDSEHTNYASIVVTDPKRGVRMIYTGNIEELIRPGRILNRPSHNADYDGSLRASENQNKLVVSDAKRLPQRAIQNGNLLRFQEQREDPRLTNSKNKNAGYTNSSINPGTHQGYVTSQRFRENDKNIYVTDAKGVNEYYITPDGKKVYT